MTWSTNATIFTAGLPVSVRRDGSDYVVTDLVGIRFGYGQSFLEAVTQWAEDVDGLIEMRENELGGPLLAEWRAYRRALGLARSVEIIGAPNVTMTCAGRPGRDPRRGDGARRAIRRFGRALERLADA